LAIHFFSEYRVEESNTTEMMIQTLSSPFFLSR